MIPRLLTRVFFVLVLSVLLTACRGERETKAPAAARGDVFLISVDTLRADRLPAYGYEGVRTPAIDALAKDAIVFDNAYSHVPLTLPSHISMLTGALPAATGVRNNLGYPFDAAAHPTIPSLLEQEGYLTGAAVSAYVLRASTGLGAAFDHYDDMMDSSEGAAAGEIQRSGFRTVAAAETWIAANGTQPLFFMLHLFEPHAPYAPPEPFRTEYAGREYDGEIATADSIVGRFIDFLKKNRMYDDATIIFFSDHGEGLGDHGEAQHGIFLYREAIRVPLFVKLPQARRRGERVNSPVGLFDILPTIAALKGFKVPPKAAGKSLLDVADGRVGERRIFSETMYPRIHLGLSDLASLADAKHHYIEAPRPELYDVEADPRETKNVVAGERRLYAAMRRELSGYDRTLAAPSRIAPEDAAKLAALGYLTAGVPDAGERRDPKDHIADLNEAARAASLIERGKPADAIPILKAVLSRNPRYADGWSTIAKAYEQSGHLDESVAAYKRAIEISPVLVAESALSLSDTLLSLGRIDESIEHAKLAIATHPGAADAMLVKGYLAKRDLAAAEGAAEGLRKEWPAEGLVALAQVRNAQKRYGDALSLIADARRTLNAVGVGPVPNLYFAEADALVHVDRIQEAEAMFEAETKAFPRNREAYVRLVVLQTLQGRLDDAEQTFQRMAAASPDRTSYALAADTFRRLGKPDIARRWSVRAR